MIEFHYTYLFIAFSFIITGHVKDLLVFTSIIIFHELGHYLMARINKVKVKKITIYPFGGITTLDTLINININRELLIAMGGILSQSIYMIIIIILYKYGFVREYIYNLYTRYNNSILYFNLLPIVSLDGFKILNLTLSKIFPFDISNKLSLGISFITLILILIVNYYTFNYTLLLVLSVLIINIVNYYKDLNYIFNKFLVERYLYNLSYSKEKIVNNKKKMYKDYRHIFKNGNKYLTEKKYLYDKYNKLLK